MKNSFLYFLSKYLNTHLPLTVGASSNTIKAYSDTFKLFFLFAKEKYNLGHLYIKVPNATCDLKVA